MTNSELFFYGGIALMIGVVVVAILCIVVFSLTGKKIKKNLESEYGKLQR